MKPDRALQRSLRTSLRVTNREIVDLDRTLSRGKKDCAKLKKLGVEAEALENETKRLEHTLQEAKESRQLIKQLLVQASVLR